MCPTRRARALGEHVRLQLRAEAFNLLNKANFELPANVDGFEQLYAFVPGEDGEPDSFEVTESVGKIFSTVGTPREIQFGVRISF